MRRCWYGFLALVVVAMMFTPAWAADDSTEAQMAAALGRCVRTLEQIRSGGDPAAGFGRLKGQEEQIRQLHLLLDDKFERQTQRLNELGSDAILRHQGMHQAYRRVVEDFLDSMEDIESVQDLTADTIEDFLEILKPVGPEKSPPIFGSLPYTHLNYAAVKPDRSTTVLPAYLDPSATTTEDDLAESRYAPKSQAISELAESLDWKPANIFDWVKNNVTTQWYWGCMKGAEETLRQKSGNDCDQAALLAALLRASGYPSRYVRGVIRFFPDIAAARRLMGVDSDADLLVFLKSAGIPHEVTFSGQGIQTLAVEHVWVETQVPYANYRGAVIDTHGKTWVALDTSIKVDGFEEKAADPVVAQFVLSPLRDLYLWQMHDTSPLEYLRAEIETYLQRLQSSNTYDGLLRTRVQRTKALKILPNALQFDTVQVTAEYTALPEQLVHTVEFKAWGSDGQTFYNQSLPTAELSNRQVLLTFEPQTVDDQEIINAFGGLDNTPAYLIRLRPVIEVEGRRQIVGSGGLPSGATLFQTITLAGPSGRQQFENSYIMGNLALIGIFAQQAVMPPDMAPEEKKAARWLHETAARYAIQWQAAEDELAALLGITLVRPAPAVVTTAGVMEVIELLDQPHDITWKGVYVDADFRAVETLGGTVMDDGSDPRVLFMQLSALQGSYLEGQTLEESFQVDGISTASLMGLAARQQIETVRIGADNIDAVLPTLFLADNINEDIINAVNQNLVVRIPTTMLTFEDWTGIGYLKENPQTGEAGYMLSGMIAGGMTALSGDRWTAYMRNTMTNPFSGEVNQDPAAAAKLEKIYATDLQKGTAGQPLGRPLQVLVRDNENRPVVGAAVVFFIKAGGGEFVDHSQELTAVTNELGIAQAGFIPGTRVDANSTLWFEPGKRYPDKVGENIVSARLSYADTQLDSPFTEFGFPGPPASFDVRFFGGGSYLTLSHTIFAYVLDQYGNPISNKNVVFSMSPTESYETCWKDSPETRYSYLIARNDPCLANQPTYGQCDTGGNIVEDISDETNGAVAFTMAGAVPGMEYEIAISCGGVSTSVWAWSTVGGNCFGTSRPLAQFSLKSRTSVDKEGNTINAAAPDSTFPLEAGIFFLREHEEESQRTYSCDGSSQTCTTIYGARTFYIDTDFTESNVTFGGLPGTAQGGGRYTIDYKIQRGVNNIDIVGSASVAGRRHNNSCTECRIEDVSIDESATISTVVYGVDVLPERNDIFVAVDDWNQSTCDVTIGYDIQPHEYKAGSAYVYIYRKDDNTGEEGLVSIITTEPQGAGSATLARGFQFDEDATYRAEVVLNPGGSSEIRSPSIQLSPGAIKVERLEMVDYATKGGVIPIGEQRKIKAFTSPTGRNVTWDITHQDNKNGEKVNVEIQSAKDDWVIIKALENSGSGWFTLRAQLANNSCVFKEARVYVGCQTCENGQCDGLAGNGFVQLSSVDIGIGLGPGRGGQAAGYLFIRADEPDSTLYTPQGLMLSTTTSDVEARYGDDQILRQVMTPEALVDIRVVNPTYYQVLFFRPEAVIGELDGLYQIDPTARTLAVWSLSSYGQTGLRVVEERDGKSLVHIYQWDSQADGWSLSKANSSQFLSLAKEKTADGRIETRTIKDKYGNIASRIRTTYRSFDWGEEVVETVNDPDGAAMTTTTEYYTDPEQAGSYGRIAKRVDSDGSWTRYEYDDQGRTTMEITPWLDSGPEDDAAQARTVTYVYEPVDPADSNADDDSHRPRAVTETIAGQIVAKTYYAYIVAADGTRTEISERCAAVDAAYGAAGNPRTVSVYNPSNTGEVDSGRIQSTRYPDGRLDSYTYDTGNYLEGDTPGIFVPFMGDDVSTIVVHGTADHPDGVAFKTTREVTITSSLGRTLLQATEVYDGSGYERIAWSIDQYDANGRVIATRTSDGRLTRSTWSCCGKESDTDADGRTTYYTYDDLHRVLTSTREGVAAGAYAAQSDIKTVYTYNGLGRAVNTTVMAGDLRQSSFSKYDRAGRLQSGTDPANLTTTYDYSPDGLTTTVTAPGDAVQTTTRHRDGRTASVTGSAVSARYYSYGVEADGSRWTEVRTGAMDSPMVQRTVTDMLGRTVRVEKPGAAGMEATENFYDDQGRLIRTRTTGRADTLYDYDELGNPIRSGLDMDANGVLEIASSDRITAGDTAYTVIGGQWWQQSMQQVYPVDNDGTPVTVSIQRSQISGLADDGEAAESVSVDIHGNITTSRTYVDRDLKMRTQVTDYPDTTIDAQTVAVNGLVMENRSKSGITATFAYDTLGRRTGVTEPRTGTAVTHYDNRGRVDYVEDAADLRTEFAYNPDTGRKISQTDALGKVTRFAYNTRGQVIRTWGEVPYPVQYDYDDYGRMTAMTTYRAEAGFDAESFPTGAAGDTTRWHYDQATGLLTAKEYADGSQVTYTYTTGGRLDTRTWARQDGGQPLVTTYSYDPATGELTLIDYSDGTPDITFAYDRLGRQSEIGDALGTHTFAYNPGLQLESETVTGLYDAVLTRIYETTGVAGRPSGFSLGAGYTVNYAYAPDTGRFQSLAWNAGGQTDTATYAYVPDADLLRGYNTTSGLQATYAYEPHRNLKTSVQNNFNSTLVSQYDYQYDSVGRRTSVANTGSAFAQAAFNRYDYNDRSELIASDRYLGTDIDNLTDPVADQQRGYLYDPIGNRTRSEIAGAATDYSTNELNQYADIAGIAPAYDPDGNMIASPEGMTFSYNAENRLIAAQPDTPADGDTRIENTYDYMGRRVQKLVYTYSAGAWNLTKEILFVYDGWNLLKETITPDGGSSVDRYYVWGLDLSQSLQGAGGVGGLLAVIDGSLTYQYMYDANGNVGQLVDAADGTIAARYEYDPYGNLADLGGVYVDANAYRFSTKYFDSETSLYYYGYRYYSAKLGRWINRDPTGEEGGLNIYVFSLNSPTLSFDPLGLKGVKYILKKLKIRGSKEIAKQAGKKLADIIIVEEKYLTRFGDEILAYKPSKRDWFFHGIPDVSEVKLINGKMPRNAQFANTNILFDDPNLKWINDLGGIRITRSGVVDFGPFVPVGKGGAELKIKWFKDSFKNRGADRRMALQQMKDMLPEGFDESKYVLHHQGDYVMFVDRSLHKAVGHTGPIAWLKENIKTGCYVAVGFFVGWQYELGYEFFRETGEDFIDLTDQLGKYKQQKQDTLDSIQ